MRSIPLADLWTLPATQPAPASSLDHTRNICLMRNIAGQLTATVILFLLAIITWVIALWLLLQLTREYLALLARILELAQLS